ncbi:hypothetical protein [Saccharopolyspora sp.]|uniref:hypothetical protein n=1 Tax=Saccharopolyspora sp. TaxID=33915 RepID=UPI00345D4EED
MSASTPLVALDGVTTANGVSVDSAATEVNGGPVAGRELPVRAELATVLPWPGLRRGSTVAVQDSTALLLALLSEATSAGSWAAVVGLPGLGLSAAAEMGVDLDRLALVPQPGGDPVSVIAALLDGVDLVVVGRPGLPADADARRLSARARHRGAVLLPFGPWPGAEVRLDCTQARWRGLGQGHGHLREREITVRAGGRGAASRPRSCRLLLPGRNGSAAERLDAEIRDLPDRTDSPDRPDSPERRPGRSEQPGCSGLPGRQHRSVAPDRRLPDRAGSPDSAAQGRPPLHSVPEDGHAG